MRIAGYYAWKERAERAEGLAQQLAEALASYRGGHPLVQAAREAGLLKEGGE